VKILSLEILATINHISKDHTLLRKSSHTHTHALHELSWLLKYLYLQGIYAHWLLNSFQYACIFLTSHLTVFTGLDTCVCWFLVGNLTLLSSFVFWSLVNVWLWFFYYTLFTLCPFMTKNGVFFVLNRECISKPIKYFFVPERRPKGEFFSILCWLHSGWKNSLYNGCYLNRIIGTDNPV